MIEIAICLAIIGFALVAIIGVLPLGMNTQRDNREETIINQDATVLLDAIRGTARGADYLTNYVYAITNYRAFYNGSGSPSQQTIGWSSADYLTNGANIIGLLSTPEFTDNNQATPLPPQSYNGYSNHIVAYVRSLSGIAAEKPPQNNQIMQEGTFTYRVYCVNAPLAVDTNTFNNSVFAQKLAASQRELRLTFLWPQLPNGKVGAGRQTFRATVAGRLAYQPTYNLPTFYYQSQSFTNAP